MISTRLTGSMSRQTETSVFDFIFLSPNSAMKQKRDAYVKRLNDIYYANLEKVWDILHNMW